MMERVIATEALKAALTEMTEGIAMRRCPHCGGPLGGGLAAKAGNPKGYLGRGRPQNFRPPEGYTARNLYGVLNAPAHPAGNMGYGSPYYTDDPRARNPNLGTIWGRQPHEATPWTGGGFFGGGSQRHYVQYAPPNGLPAGRGLAPPRPRF
jgi:hypothetical protein